MELVHDHVVDFRELAFVQGHVGQDLGRAADDGRISVDRAIAGDHADLLWPELTAKLEEFLVHQGLDWTRIDGSLPHGERVEMQSHGDETFPRSRRRVQDDVLAFDQSQDRFFLSGVELEVFFIQVIEKAVEHEVVRELLEFRKPTKERKPPRGVTVGTWTRI